MRVEDDLVLLPVREPCGTEDGVRLERFSEDVSRYLPDSVGRLEVCSGGFWGSVCGIGAADTIADVVCTQLNHAIGGK